MKEFHYYKSALALATAGITLLTGYTEGAKQSENLKQSQSPKKEKSCEHLIVYFTNQPTIFKECQGYNIRCIVAPKNGEIEYIIYQGNEKEPLLNGYTRDYNSYFVDHSANTNIDEIETQAVEKGAYVYTISSQYH